MNIYLTTKSTDTKKLFALPTKITLPPIIGDVIYFGVDSFVVKVRLFNAENDSLTLQVEHSENYSEEELIKDGWKSLSK